LEGGLKRSIFEKEKMIALRRGYAPEADAIGSFLINPTGCTFPGTASESLT
jgi:hypothetical protein